MRARQLVQKKREGLEHTPSELQYLIQGLVSGDISSAQTAAWLMAVFFRGLSSEETAELTRLMWRSGATLPRLPSAFEGERPTSVRIDKHSTGGVGDKTSLILIPLVISTARRIFGSGHMAIPMISGRGLGHSGGTLDKIESVSGFRTNLSIEEALALLSRHGFFLAAQTHELVPADRILYALRNETATVESIPLIVSSILSKKLSENLDGLVLDIKTGSGAFLPTLQQARALALALRECAAENGLCTTAVISQMDEPLGRAIGNLLEVRECARFLKNEDREPGLFEVSVALATEMLVLASGSELEPGEAKSEVLKSLEGSAPYEVFREMLTAQGGELRTFDEDCLRLEERRCMLEWRAPEGGFVSKMEPRRIAHVVNLLAGCGRGGDRRKSDPFAGAELIKKVGDSVRQGELIGKFYFGQPDEIAEAVEITGANETESIHSLLTSALSISSSPVAKTQWLLECYR